MDNNSPSEEDSYSPVYFERYIDLTIEGEPVGKGRPRVTSRGKFAHAYTPAKTKNYERLASNTYLEKYNYDDQLKGPIEATMECYFPIPKGFTKKVKKFISNNKVYYTKKPDIDNIVKSVLDSLNGLAYEDDSQIIKLSVKKLYSDNPRVELHLKELYNNNGENK